MKILICINDLIADEPGLLLGKMLAQQFEVEITLLHVLPRKKVQGDRTQGGRLLEQAARMLDISLLKYKIRRGNVVEVSSQENATKIVANAPLSELFGYATVLRSITQGRASYTMQFERYEPVPDSVAQKIIGASKKS